MEQNKKSELGFTINLKKYDETKNYNEYGDKTLAFDPSFLELDSVTDIHQIMNEINGLALKIFTYGSACDMQARVVQQIEDEFERWKAIKYHEEGVDDKQFKSEKSKERHIYIKYPMELQEFQNRIENEKYKLSMIQRVVKSLESFGYKLHDLKDYNLAIERNS